MESSNTKVQFRDEKETEKSDTDSTAKKDPISTSNESVIERDDEKAPQHLKLEQHEIEDNENRRGSAKTIELSPTENEFSNSINISVDPITSLKNITIIDPNDCVLDIDIPDESVKETPQCDQDDIVPYDPNHDGITENVTLDAMNFLQIKPINDGEMFHSEESQARGRRKSSAKVVDLPSPERELDSRNDKTQEPITSLKNITIIGDEDCVLDLPLRNTDGFLVTSPCDQYFDADLPPPIRIRHDSNVGMSNSEQSEAQDNVIWLGGEKSPDESEHNNNDDDTSLFKSLKISRDGRRVSLGFHHNEKGKVEEMVIPYDSYFDTNITENDHSKEDGTNEKVNKADEKNVSDSD